MFTAFFITTTRLLRRSSRWQFCALFVICGLVIGTLSYAQDATPAERFERLRAANSLDREGLKPWHLKLSFQLNDMNGKPEDSGTAEAFWPGNGKQKTLIESKLIHGDPGSDEGPGNRALAREAFLLQSLLNETIRPVPPLPQLDIQILEQKRNFGKVPLICLAVVAKSHPSAADASGPQYCIEPAMPDVLRAVISPSQGALRNRLGKFQNTNVTLDNAILYNGIVAISGKTESLTVYTPDAADITAAPQYSSVRISGAVIAGQRIKGMNPEYPRIARMDHVSGTVILHAIISKSGQVTNLVSIASPDASLTAASIDAVKRWTYKPYLLNGEPTEVDTTITVNFNLN